MSTSPPSSHSSDTELSTVEITDFSISGVEPMTTSADSSIDVTQGDQQDSSLTESVVEVYQKSRKRRHSTDEESSIGDGFGVKFYDEPVTCSQTEEMSVPVQTSNTDDILAPKSDNEPVAWNQIEEMVVPDQSVISEIDHQDVSQVSSTYAPVLIRRLPTKYVITPEGECRVHGHEAGPSTLRDDTQEYTVLSDSARDETLSRSISLSRYSLLDLICQSRLMRTIDLTVIYSNVPVIIDRDGLRYHPTSIMASGLTCVNRDLPSIQDIRDILPYALQNRGDITNNIYDNIIDKTLATVISRVILTMELYFNLLESVTETIADNEIFLWDECEDSLVELLEDCAQIKKGILLAVNNGAMALADASDFLRLLLPTRLVGTALIEQMVNYACDESSWDELLSTNLMKITEVYQVVQSKFLLNLALVIIQDGEDGAWMANCVEIMQLVCKKFVLILGRLAKFATEYSRKI